MQKCRITNGMAKTALQEPSNTRRIRSRSRCQCRCRCRDHDRRATVSAVRTRSVRVAAVLILSPPIRAGAQYTKQNPGVYGGQVDGTIPPPPAANMTPAPDAPAAAPAPLIGFIL